MDYNDIFEPNHLNSENIIVESYYDMDSDASNASSSASSTSSVSSVSSQKSNASTQSQRKSIPWVETHSFKELGVADAYVSELTSTRDSTNILKKRVPEFLVPMVKSDIKLLHSTLTQEDYNFQLTVVKARWSDHSSLKDFLDYFWSEWVDGRFKRWQIWNTPCPGIATTNSCIESFNKQVKFAYTGYELYSVLQCLFFLYFLLFYCVFLFLFKKPNISSKNPKKSAQYLKKSTQNLLNKTNSHRLCII